MAWKNRWRWFRPLGYHGIPKLSQRVMSIGEATVYRQPDLGRTYHTCDPWWPPEISCDPRITTVGFGVPPCVDGLPRARPCQGTCSRRSVDGDEARATVHGSHHCLRLRRVQRLQQREIRKVGSSKERPRWGPGIGSLGTLCIGSLPNDQVGTR